MLALRAGPPQTVTFCAAHKKRHFAPAHAAGVGMTPHVKINVQIPADCTARAFFFFN